MADEFNLAMLQTILGRGQQVGQSYLQQKADRFKRLREARLKGTEASLSLAPEITEKMATGAEKTFGMEAGTFHRGKTVKGLGLDIKKAAAHRLASRDPKFDMLLKTTDRLYKAWNETKKEVDEKNYYAALGELVEYQNEVDPAHAFTSFEEAEKLLFGLIPTTKVIPKKGGFTPTEKEIKVELKQDYQGFEKGDIGTISESEFNLKYMRKVK